MTESVERFITQFKDGVQGCHMEWDNAQEFAEELCSLLDERDALKGKLKNIISHATMGTMDDSDAGMNDICVQITSIRNDMYTDGLERGRVKERDRCFAIAMAEVTAMSEGAQFSLHPRIEPDPLSSDTSYMRYKIALAVEKVALDIMKEDQ